MSFIARFSVIAALALLLAIGPAQADPRLRGAPVVDGGEITLGDLFEGVAPAAARAIVALAPPYGGRIELPVSLVAAAAQRHGLAWAPATDARTIAVRRAGRAVPRQEILDRLSDAIERESGVGAVEIVYNGKPPVLFVAPEAAASVRIEDLDYDRRSGRFTARLLAPANDRHAERIAIAGRALPVNAVPVLKNRVGAGDVIGKNDIEWREVRAERIGRNIITRLDDLVGQSARRIIAPGQPVRTSDVKRPELVAKGALVTMALSAPGLRLSAGGRAIESGGLGDVIPVMNSQSKRTIQATVIGPNQVQVTSHGQVVSNTMH